MQYNFSIYKCSMCRNCVTAAEIRLEHSKSCFRTEIFCNLYIIRFQTRLLFVFTFSRDARLIAKKSETASFPVFT